MSTINISTPLSSSSTQTYGGLSINVREIIQTLPVGLFSNPPRIYLNQGSGNSTTHASILRIYAIDATTSSFEIIITDLGTATNFEVHWLAIDELTMGTD